MRLESRKTQMKVVVVESPAKAKTINKYLGRDYRVLASFGHVRDLPSKDGSVQPENDFLMNWEVEGRGQKQLKEIADAVKDADKLILATDPDREGEAISWHIIEALKAKRGLGKVPFERVAFNEITKRAVLDAINNPRKIDQELVDAYLARRALDYLVGFTLSPVLWRKLPGSRSAGRVQSVALRIICEREAEIEAFKPREYWTIEADFTGPDGSNFTARLTHVDGKKLDKFDLADEAAAQRGRGQGARRRAVQGRRGRAQAGQAAPLPALHHLDPAAGSLAQARLRRQPHHAHRAAAVRGRRYRRRDHRHHHLHAHRRRYARAGCDRGQPQADRRAVRQGVPAGFAAHLQERPRRTRRKRTRRSARPTCSAGPTRSAAICATTRPRSMT